MFRGLAELPTQTSAAAQAADDELTVGPDGPTVFLSQYFVIGYDPLLFA